MLRNNWPEVRAGLIAFAILLGLIDGCPLAPPDYVPGWQRGITAVVRPIQHAVLTPFNWITLGIRFKQRWALFQVAEADRFQLQVLARAANGTWSMLYRASDPDHAAYADMLDSRRVRGAWNPTDQTPYQYVPFAGWFTQRVLDEHPDIVEVRLRFEKVVLDRGKMVGTGVFVAPYARSRGAT